MCRGSLVVPGSRNCCLWLQSFSSISTRAPHHKSPSRGRKIIPNLYVLYLIAHILVVISQYSFWCDWVLCIPLQVRPLPKLSEQGEEKQEETEEPDLSIPGSTYMRLMARTPLPVLPGEWRQTPRLQRRCGGHTLHQTQRGFRSCWTVGSCCDSIINQSSSFYLMTQ